VQIDKAQIIELLKSRGDTDKAAQADAELPEKVDTERDQSVLDKLGINVQDLAGRLPGGLGGLMG